jgi:plastocyanin
MKLRRLVAVLALLAGVLVVPAAAAGGFCSRHSTFSDARGRGLTVKGNVVRMKDNCFDATVMRVRRGATVVWINEDPEPHTVGGAAGRFGDMHGEVAAGDSIAYRFDEEGVYPYVCILHPGMAGAIVVGDGEGSDGGTVAAVAPPAPPQEGGESTGKDAGRASQGQAMQPSVAGIVASVAFLVILVGVVVRLVLAARGARAAGAVVR